MNKAQKGEQVEALRGIFAESGGVVVTHYAGLTVADMTALRTKLGAVGARFKVVKNRLAKRALEGLPGEGAASLFTGPVGIAFAKDPVAVSKAAVDYAADNENLVLVGGILGASILDDEGVKQLAKMPSIEELRAKLLGVLNAPAGKFVRTLNAPASDFVSQLNAPAQSLLGVLQAHAAKQAA